MMIEYEKTQRIHELQTLLPLHESKQKIDFQTKYKKALKQIYDVIQANKQLKQQLQKLKTSRNKLDSSMSDIRKQEFYKVYDSVLRQKNQLSNLNFGLQMDKQRLIAQLQNLQAHVDVLRNDKLNNNQQKEALENCSFKKEGVLSYRGTDNTSKKNEELQQLQFKIKQREAEFHRTIQNYEQHHLSLSRQVKKSEQRVQELQQKLLSNDKMWRDRFESKQIQIKQIKTIIRHQYQDQINNLRKQINSLKHLNTQLMTKIQTMQMQSNNRQGNGYDEYQMQLVNSLIELKHQMEPMKRQMLELQDVNSFEKEQAERERTALQMKVYQMEADIERHKMLMKRQEEKLLLQNEELQKHQDNNYQIHKLQEDNRILGGRLIVLESKDIVSSRPTHNANSHPSRHLQQKVLQFQNRVQLLLSDKQNIANLKNITVHQLLSLKAYILSLDQKLGLLSEENGYAVKKYKNYKEKYLSVTKQIKQYQVIQNSLKEKILGYDKLVQRLQSQLQKNVTMSEMQIINMNSKNSSQIAQIQLYKKKYQTVKQKLTLQQKYHKQEIQTLSLNYEARMLDLHINHNEVTDYRQSVNMYREKNQQLIDKLTMKENELLELRLQMGKQKSEDAERIYSGGYAKQIVNGLQETVHKQQMAIFKLQQQSRQQQDTFRRRILSLQRQLQQSCSEVSRHKMTNSSRFTTQKSIEQLSSQNKKLRTQISSLENQIMLSKTHNISQYSMNPQEVQFKLSAIEMQRDHLGYKLDTEITGKKRLEGQLVELAARNNQLQGEVMQLSMQLNRKIQELKYEISEKDLKITQLEQDANRLKQRSMTQRPSMDSSAILSMGLNRQDSTINELKLQRMQKRVKQLQLDNQELKRKTNTNLVATNTSFSYNYEVENLKQDKQEARMRIERLEREMTTFKQEISSLEQDVSDKNRQINQLRSEWSEERLKIQDEVYEKQRMIAQLKSRIQFGDTATSANSLQIMQYEQRLAQRQREASSLRGKINSYESTISELHESINRYTIELNSLKPSVSGNSTYIEHMEQSLEQKQRLLVRFREQNTKLSNQLDDKLEQLTIKQQQLIKLQRESQQYKEYEMQVDRLKYSLNDRESLLNKNKYEIMQMEEQNQRVRHECGYLKEEMQKVKYFLLQKEDEVSRLQLELNSAKIKITNQLQQEYMQQGYEKEEIISRLNIQSQNLKAEYQNLQNELNESQSHRRKLNNQTNFLKSQISRANDQINELSQKLTRSEQQFSHANSELSSMRFLSEQLNQKNILFSRLKVELTELKINTSHFEEELLYKDGLCTRLQNEASYMKNQLMEKEQTINSKQDRIRALNNEILNVRSQYEEIIFMMGEKDLAVNRLNAELARTKNQFRDLEEEIEEREQEWSNLSYELNQAKNQVSLISDQIQSKQVNISKFFNENVFLKQQLTRINEEVVLKSHEINRVNQLMFTQKMQYTEQFTFEKQGLQKQIFSLKRQNQTLNHQIQDLQLQTRRMKIQNQTSRVQLQNISQTYTEEEMQLLKQDLNRKYRQIMRLQLQLNQKQHQIQNLTQQVKRADFHIHQIQQQFNDDRFRIEKDIEAMISKQKKYQQKIEQLMQSNAHNTRVPLEQSNTRQEQYSTQSYHNSSNQQELKFGLHLYTEETDRLNRIITELNEEVNQLRLKMMVMTNQQDRVEENLVIMALSFAEVQALRQRLQQKQGEIEVVRKSFIKSIVASNDQAGISTRNLGGYANRSVVSMTNNQDIQSPPSINKVSILNVKQNKQRKQQQQEMNNVVHQDEQCKDGQDVREIKTRSEIDELNELKDAARHQVESVVQSERSEREIHRNQVALEQSYAQGSVTLSEKYNYRLVGSVAQVIQPHIQVPRVSVTYQQASGRMATTQSIPQQSGNFIRVANYTQQVQAIHPMNMAQPNPMQRQQIMIQHQQPSQSLNQLQHNSQRIIINNGSQQIMNNKFLPVGRVQQQQYLRF